MSELQGANIAADIVGQPIRVLVLDDHPVVAEALALTLSHAPGIQVVGVATSAAEAEEIAAAQRPDVALLDFYLPDGTGAEAAHRIRSHLPTIAILMLTASTDDKVLRAAVAAGACGFLLKTQAAAQIVTAVRHAAEGEMLIPPSTLVGLLAGTRNAELPEHGPGLQGGLTRREREILALMARGMSNRRIAEQLVLDKLGAHSRLEAVARASQQGLLNA